MKKLQIDKIRTDGDTQPRVEINSEVVAEYAEAMKAKAKFLPVIVFHDGSDYWLVDGFHRVQAAKKNKRKQIECEIREGTQDDARWFSYQVNSTHGLRRTNTDKQKAVKAALLHPKGEKMSVHIYKDTDFGDDCYTLCFWENNKVCQGEPDKVLSLSVDVFESLGTMIFKMLDAEAE